MLPRFLRPRLAPALLAGVAAVFPGQPAFAAPPPAARERVSFDADWRFVRHDPADAAGRLDYTKLRDWILPTGGELIDVGQPRPVRPAGKSAVSSNTGSAGATLSTRPASCASSHTRAG